jgi:hypothetical protein
MIKSKLDMQCLCGKRLSNLSLDETKLLIFNYIYYKTGKQVPEVFTAQVKDIDGYGQKLRIAYDYFENIEI